MMKMNGKVDFSVVMPAYRAADTIARALDSVFSSNEITPEVIVVEDGVFDNLKDIVLAYTGVRLITNDVNMGAAASRNIGLELVTTDCVFFLDSDDHVSPDFFANLKKAMLNDKSDVVFGSWCFEYDGTSNPYIHVPELCENTVLVAKWLRNDCAPPCSYLWSTSAIRSIGGWKSEMRNSEDLELMIRAMLSGLKFSFIQEGCGYYVQHDSPHRVTRAAIEIFSDVSWQIFEMVRKWVENRQETKPIIKPALGEFAYERARRCYRAGSKRLGDNWLSEARGMGVKGHLGSGLHRFSAGLIGLANKEKISSLVRKQKKFD